MQYSGLSIYRREEEDEPGLNVPAAGPPIFGRRAIEYIERAYSKRRWAAIHHHAISDPQTVLPQLCVDSWWIPIKNSGWFISICTHTSRRILMKDNGSIAWPAFNFLFGFFWSSLFPLCFISSTVLLVWRIVIHLANFTIHFMGNSSPPASMELFIVLEIL